jgi:catechol 2,3-dioxygenase-like lactoylglutathione lyase family enzyme
MTGSPVTARIHAVHPVLAANDVMASVNFYSRLGFHLSFQDDALKPRYATVRRDGIELHLQWASVDQWSHPVDRPACRFTVSDVDEIYREFVASGGIGESSEEGSPWRAPADTPWGTREFHLRDPGQNSLQFYRVL